jgi:hypothetical protein
MLGEPPYRYFDVIDRTILEPLEDGGLQDEMEDCPRQEAG